VTESSNIVQSPPRGTYRLRLAPHEVRELRKYLSVIVARVRAAMADVGEPGPHSIKKVTIDLAGAPTAPGAQLVVLVRLLRRTLGEGVLIELSGVTPTILTSLVAFGIPQDVTVIDSRGRPWTG
jgi:ABC-type transporter Mla MlaB component